MQSTAEYIEQEQRFGAHNYHPVEVVLSRAKGALCWDVEGREYIDLMSAYSTASLGHSNPTILRALRTQAARLDVTSRAYYNDQLPEWLALLAELTGLPRVLPMNTGAEAVDSALKIARKWGETVKRVPTDAGHIIACEGNFHGRTFGALSLSTEAQYRENFGPHLPGMSTVPYGDSAALEAAITPHTVAFIVEPIQGEAGINIPPAGYLKRVRELCTRHRVLLILDEVQTGFARTGKLFCHQHDGILPDMMTLGKALGGGVYPVSAVVGTEEALGVLKPGDHGSTFGGNAIAAAVSLAALKLLADPKLAERSQKLGDHAMAWLRAKLDGNSLVTDIRGKGLFIGIEVSADVGARVVVDRLMAVGVLSKDTHHTVVRLAPPLTISQAHLMTALQRIVKVLQDLDSGQDRTSASAVLEAAGA